jgi:hypothetical protein
MKDQQQLMARYQQLRKIGMGVAQDAIERLSREDMHEGGRMLGILKNDKMVFGDENEMPVLMDFCIHQVRRGGRTAIDRLLDEAPYPPGSDQAMVAQALKEAYFSCFEVHSREPGVGVHVVDVVRDESLLIHDMAFSQSAQPGLLLACHVISPENLLMTTGAATPVGMRPEGARPGGEEGIQALKSMLGGKKTLAQRTQAIAALIRFCLEKGAMSHIDYQDLGRATRPTSPRAFPGPSVPHVAPSAFTPPSVSRTPKPPPGVGVYDPCPCGSGKKFKFCCGKRS